MYQGSFHPIREYVFTPGTSTDGTESADILSPVKEGEPTSRQRKAQIWVKGDDVTLKFGPKGVKADKTVTANKLVDGNFTVPNGCIWPVELDPSMVAVSMVNDSATTNVKVRILLYEGDV